MEKKFWAVTRGWQLGVYDDYMTVDRVTRGYKGSAVKTFTDYNEACDYVREHQRCRSTKKSLVNRSDALRRKNDKAVRALYCRACGKPIKSKRNKGLCIACLNMPDNERGIYKIDKSKTRYDNEADAPEYINNLLGYSKELIKIDGSKRNPMIYFKCKRCRDDFAVRYEELKKHRSHDCDGILSSGETAVKEYLDKRNIRYKTQYDTLKCINPVTGHIMPYDFELSDKKVIIEIQGEQHRRYIEYFHGTEDGFIYQQNKDKHKKDFAVDKGYTYIEIWYDQFTDGEYKNILNECI